MAEVRFQIADDVIGTLREKINASSNTDVAREALTLLKWAVDEREKGHVILSADPDMKEPLVRLAMPSLERISKKA
jgi:hypothetical protein